MRYTGENGVKGETRRMNWLKFKTQKTTQQLTKEEKFRDFLYRSARNLNFTSAVKEFCGLHPH